MTETTAPSVKPGWKTTEFWLTALANVVGLLLASGAITDDSGFGKILGLAVMALSSAGYSVGRGKAKSGQAGRVHSGLLIGLGLAGMFVVGVVGGTLQARAARAASAEAVAPIESPTQVDWDAPHEDHR